MTEYTAEMTTEFFETLARQAREANTTWSGPDMGGAIYLGNDTGPVQAIVVADLTGERPGVFDWAITDTTDLYWAELASGWANTENEAKELAEAVFNVYMERQS